MGHQYIEQLSDKVKAAVFGNVGTLVVFRVGATDAEELVKEFTPVFTEEDLVNLPKYNICLKLMIDGVASDPFSARGLAPLSEAEKTQNSEKVIGITREKYSAPREEVEDKIMRWHNEEDAVSRVTVTRPSVGQKPDTKGLLQEVRSSNSQTPLSNNNAVNPTVSQPVNTILDPSIYKYEAICSRCKNTTRVPFKPDGVRPVFCKDCLTILRQENEQSSLERKVVKQKEIEQFVKKPTYSASFSKPMPLSQRVNQPVAPQQVVEKTPTSQPLSLRDLSSRAPNDFKGRPLQRTDIRKESSENIQAPQVNIHSPASSDLTTEAHKGYLKPGEPVHFE